MKTRDQNPFYWCNYTLEYEKVVGGSKGQWSFCWRQLQSSQAGYLLWFPQSVNCISCHCATDFWKFVVIWRNINACHSGATESYSCARRTVHFVVVGICMLTVHLQKARCLVYIFLIYVYVLAYLIFSFVKISYLQIYCKIWLFKYQHLISEMCC